MRDYTRPNVQEACKKVLEACGVPKVALSTMIENGYNLPDLLRMACELAFIEDIPQGTLVGEQMLCRKAARKLKTDGAFGFAEKQENQ